ncbi:MAG: hypothetical protein WD942_01575 [Dehalococcoidia bacterium]
MIMGVQMLRTSLVVMALCMLSAQPAYAQHLDGLVRIDTEAEARQMVGDYYEWLVGGMPDCTSYYLVTKESAENWRAGLYRPLCQFIPEGRGDASLMDCFGGETLCVELAQKCRVRATVVDRNRLIERLEGLPPGEGATESDWVVGQLVNLLLKNGELDRAQNVADRCEASLWWCQALRGHVRHRRVPAEGEAELDSALTNAPADLVAWRKTGSETDAPGLRCAWTDISVLLSEFLRSEYERLTCEERSDFEARLWWLADSTWSEEGNERRAEHLSRNVQLRLDDDIAPPSLFRREAIVRAGWPNSWRSYQAPRHPREDPVRMTPELRERHEMYVRGGYSFVPDGEIYVDPEESSGMAWAVEGEPKAERFVTEETWYDVLRHQTAVLRRDEDLLVLTTALLPVIVDNLDGVDASLAMGRPADRTLEVADASVQEGVVRASNQVDDGEWLASVELRGREWRGRLRQGIPPPSLDNGFGISDPVFVNEEPDSADESVLASMLPTTDMSGRTSVGVYFEVYGVADGEALELSVEIDQTNRSFLGRLGGFFGIGSSQSYAVDWTESADASSTLVSPRYLEIRLDGLDEGQYEVRVSVTRGSGGTVATSARTISVG